MQLGRKEDPLQTEALLGPEVFNARKEQSTLIACTSDATTGQIVATGTSASGNLNGKTITSSVVLADPDPTDTNADPSGTITIGSPTAP